jgi:FkbM family methyltransferase
MNPINFFTYNIIRLLDKHLHQRKIKFYLSKVLKNPKYILDIGAHKGFYSDLFLKLYSSVKIILFEPNLILYKKLKKRFANNQNIKIYNFGIGDKNKYEKFLTSSISDYVSTFSIVNKKSKYLFLRNLIHGQINQKINYKLVKIKQLDKISIIKKKRIDLIKIDVEGYEEKVINGALKTLNKTKLILIENHKDNLYLNYNPKEIHRKLIELNFKLYKKIKFPFMTWEDRIYIKDNLL